jgi:methane/ammonia monooxygenase subunit B
VDNPESNPIGGKIKGPPMTTRQRLVAALFLMWALAFGYASAAYAHGERAQEAFLRTQTVAFFDVKFSGDKIKQGEEWTVTGTMKILETWPETLGPPEVAYIGITAPGPVGIMTQRIINGKDAPHSLFVKRGDVFDFKMTLKGRRPGHWHLHPIIGIEGAGSLLGPGQWVTIEEVPGGFSFPLTLLNGETIDVENYGLSVVLVLQILGFIVGLWFMWHWTGPRPTVTRLAVTNLINLHDTGEDFGLITQKDHRYMNLFAILMLVLLIGGWIYTENAYPDQIPLQVVRFEPPQPQLDPLFVQAKATGRATYDIDQTTLVIPIQLTNLGSTPATLNGFTASTLTFAREPAQGASRLEVEPEGAIGANETKSLKLTLRDPAWADERLIPIGEAQMLITGAVIVGNLAGQKNRITIQAPLELPKGFEKYGGARAY